MTVELGEGNQASGFVFPDNEGQVQHEFLINRDYAVAAAKSAVDPDDPVSPVKIDTEPFYTDVSEIDPQKSFNPMSDFTFAHSYNGARQPVQVLAKRDLDDDGVEDPVTLMYSINGGTPISVRRRSGKAGTGTGGRATSTTTSWKAPSRGRRRATR